MPFLGNEPSNTFVSIAKQTITGNGGTVYALAQAVTNAADLDVYVNNIRQEPYVAYNASGTAITFTDAIASTDSVYWLFNGQTIGTISPATGSVGPTALDRSYLESVGGTISGGTGLIISGSLSSLLRLNAASGGNADIDFKNTAGSSKWTLSHRESGAGDLWIYNHAGGNKFFGIDTSGRISKPYQVSFLAKPSSNAASEINGSGVFTWGNIILNVGSGYSSSTGRFTAPVSGVYVITANIMANSGTGRFQTVITKNGVWMCSGGGNSNDYIHSNPSVVLYLAAGDYVEHYKNVGTVYGSASEHAFSGYLLG